MHMPRHSVGTQRQAQEGMAKASGNMVHHGTMVDIKRGHRANWPFRLRFLSRANTTTPQIPPLLKHRSNPPHHPTFPGLGLGPLGSGPRAWAQGLGPEAHGPEEWAQYPGVGLVAPGPVAPRPRSPWSPGLTARGLEPRDPVSRAQPRRGEG